MPTALRGYLDLPSAYYAQPSPPLPPHQSPTGSTTSSEPSPRGAQFATNLHQRGGSLVGQGDGDSGSPIQRAFRKLHERRKSRAEVEEERWFGGLISEEEERRKMREWRFCVAGLAILLALGGVWWGVSGLFVG